MFDITRLREGDGSLADKTSRLALNDLRDLTNVMIDRQLKLIADATDADVVFIPSDPGANDTYAASEEDTALAWTLGHVIVHVTASSEEAAFVAAEQARGILREGRSRYEVPWESVTTIQQCRDRLEESRRMRLATLDVWPDEPHMEVVATFRQVPGPINPVVRFIFGLGHDADHLEQIAEIMRQAKAAREGEHA
jgi:hypothetical protein